jgi:hypothetical protein
VKAFMWENVKDNLKIRRNRFTCALCLCYVLQKNI